MRLKRIFAFSSTGKQTFVKKMCDLCVRKGILFPILDTDRVIEVVNPYIWQIKGMMEANGQIDVFNNMITPHLIGDVVKIINDHFDSSLIISNLVTLTDYDVAFFPADESVIEQNERLFCARNGYDFSKSRLDQKIRAYRAALDQVYAPTKVMLDSGMQMSGVTKSYVEDHSLHVELRELK